MPNPKTPSSPTPSTSSPPSPPSSPSSPSVPSLGPPPTSPRSSSHPHAPTSLVTQAQNANENPSHLQAGPIVAVVVVVIFIVAISIAVYLMFRRRARLQETHVAFNATHDARRSDEEGYQRPLSSRKSTAVKRNHAAARISPYGSTTNLMPRYNHAPGLDMRIATRRPDGAWEFSRPGAPFNPTGVDEIEPPASASILAGFTASVSSLTSSSSSTTAISQLQLAPVPLSLPPANARSSAPPSAPPSEPLPDLPSEPPSLPPSFPNTPVRMSTFSSTTVTSSFMEPPKSPAQIMKERESKAARLIRKGYDDREFSDEPPPPAYGQEPCYLDHTSQPRFDD